MVFDDIKLHYPNIWIQDVDSSRIIDIISATIDKEYYKIDFVKGFSKLCGNEWKQILVENPYFQTAGGDQYTVTFDLAIATDYLYKLHKKEPALRSFIVDVIGDPRMLVAGLSGHIANLRNQYRQAFWNNDISEIAFQFVFLASQPCPEEYAHLFRAQEELYPSVEELGFIINHIQQHSNNKVVLKDSVSDIARAGIGLSESDFIQHALSSVVKTSEISAQHIYNIKTANIKKHGILEIIKPTISFKDIAGLDVIKDIIHRTAILRSNPEKAKSFGIVPVRRMLMVGVPGTGKSAICQATAKELNLDLARTGVSQVMNSFIGQSEANMRAVFKQIKALSPLCVWIDEFGRDLSGGASSSSVDGGTTDRVHGEFLTGLQELPEDTFLLCAANQLDSLRPEMLRADRFDKIMFVGLPSHDERKHIFKIHLDKIDTDHTFDYDALADSSKFMTGAEIVSLIKETKFYVVTDNFRPIQTGDILNRIPFNKNIIWLKHQDMVKSMYAYALEQWDWASEGQFNDATKIVGGTLRGSHTPKVEAKSSFSWSSK